MMQTDLNRLQSLKPTWYDNMTLVSTDHQYKYHKYSYCGIQIIENWERTHFNANAIMEQVLVRGDAINESGRSVASHRIIGLMSGKFWTRMEEQHPDWFFSWKGAGSTKHGFGGVYMRWNLFAQFINDACPGASMYLDCGMEIPVDKSGYLYWCKPQKNKPCLGTDTIKVGRTWDWKQRKFAYGPKTEEYRIIRTHDMYTDEALMQKAVQQFLSNDTAKGDEYYILPREADNHDKLETMMEAVFYLLEDKYKAEEKTIKLTELLEATDDEEQREHYKKQIAFEQEWIARYAHDLEHFMEEHGQYC